MPPTPTTPVAPTGLVLAAGAGSRYGMPKILVPGWLDAAVTALREGGCVRVLVVTGAARPDLAPGVEEAHADAWAQGPGASLRAGLRAAGDVAAEGGVVVSLVDTPDVDAACVARVLGACDTALPRIARARFAGRAGHPVAIPGRLVPELARFLAASDPRHGARDFLAACEYVGDVECGDLATGADIDAPDHRPPPATTTSTRPGPSTLEAGHQRRESA